jgi:hypothetical protein
VDIVWNEDALTGLLVEQELADLVESVVLVYE